MSEPPAATQREDRSSRGPQSQAGSVVEWGEADDRRYRWWDRILGREPEAATRPHGLNTAALVCAGVAFFFVLAALALPWVRLTTNQPANAFTANLGTDRLTLGQIFSFLVPSYVISLLLLFGCVGALLAVPASARRVLTAVAAGLAAGHAACVAGLVATVQAGADLARSGLPDIADATSIGEGAYAAVVAAVMLVVTIVVANRQPRHRRTASVAVAVEHKFDQEPAGRGPIDLTVTPLGPSPETGTRRWSGL
jgi:hypothetical protein